MTHPRPRSRRPLDVNVRNTRAEDADGIIALCREVYPESPPWTHEQLASHLRVFPQGQVVAVDYAGRLLGMAASLVILWKDYRPAASWRDFTDGGFFTNHDPKGRTLYGAEVMVHPDAQGRGVGRALYEARRRICIRQGLLRIRAAARLRGYHRHAGRMRVEDYVLHVRRGELFDPTVSFQIRNGFEVLDIVPGYLKNDPESLGFAVIIEWINPLQAKREAHQGSIRQAGVPFPRPV